MPLLVKALFGFDVPQTDALHDATRAGPEFGIRVDPDLAARIDAALVLDALDREMDERIRVATLGEDSLILEPELRSIDAGD